LPRCSPFTAFSLLLTFKVCPHETLNALHLGKKNRAMEILNFILSWDLPYSWLLKKDMHAAACCESLVPRKIVVSGCLVNVYMQTCSNMSFFCNTMTEYWI
jgi:hypothetical protein